jgi:hypothetical protein
MYKLLLGLAFVFSLTFYPLVNPINAEGPETYNLPTQKTLPGSSSYPLKRLKEKVGYFFAFSQNAKINYQLSLVEKRISEVVSLVDQKQIDPLELSGYRFAAQSGEAANLVVNGTPEQKGRVINQFNGYITILGKLRDKFPANSSYWLVMQQDIDSLKLLTDKLK